MIIGTSNNLEDQIAILSESDKPEALYKIF